MRSVARAAAVMALLASLLGCAHREPAPSSTERTEALPSPTELALRQRAADVVFTAMGFLDTPYAYGGNTAQQGFDCSGFTRHVFAQTLSLALPRRAEQQAQARQLRSIERSDLAPGDLVFFNTLQRAYSHVGIYVGGGRFIHAPRSGSAVRVDDMRGSYWASRFDGARRVAAAEGDITPVAE